MGMKHLVSDRIPRDYCEAPFWGNGSMGALLYIRENRLCFSLDHVGLWELRESLPDVPHADYDKIVGNPYEYLHSGQEYVEDTDIFTRAYGRTKLPGLSMWLKLPGRAVNFVCDLDMQTGTGNIGIALEGGEQLRFGVWLDAVHNIFVIRASGMGEHKITEDATGWDLESEALAVLRNWNYPSCKKETRTWGFVMEQEYSGDRSAFMAVRKAADGAQTVWYVSLSSGEKTQRNRRREETEALLLSYAQNEKSFLEEHKKIYRKFWDGFDIRIPNERLQQAFYIEMYKVFCNERQDSLPVTLQGIWNPDSVMPPWFGDLHNDLNVQACYWAAFKTGNCQRVYPYIRYYAKAVPRFMERAKKLFGVDDAIHIPTMMAPDGYGAASEWCFWNTLLGPELYVSVDFCWYYEYSQDRAVLKEHIIPFLQKAVNLYRGIAREDEDGVLHIPLTHSPEVFDDEGMLMKPDSTFIISSLRYVTEKLLCYMQLAGCGEDAADYRTFLEKLPEVCVTEKGYPLFPDTDIFESHRHLSQMFPVFPLSYDAHSDTAEKSLDAVLDLGFTEYAAFTFPYLAIMAARCHRGNMCRTMLENYCMGFRSPNSFTVNGDPYQNGLLKVAETNGGESSRAFTLESGLMVPAALCEMFVHRAKDVLYVAAGLPDEWSSCSARGIAVEGGHRISVTVEAYAVKEITIEAGRTEELSLAIFQRRGAGRESEKYEKCIALVKGECVTVDAGN